ncbi:hypothetical protein QF032_003787 [Streptomyces achromogenes]|uniref:hypothetical protein n=1 Tax=Streptomyces achromogenes TaxID=67255 RepID=UPI002789D50A|nr:hypothetical protein [Streptomyces achromogenes]MDQ0831943.1 hypothetical protein [Streptomyces achromogenes]
MEPQEQIILTMAGRIAELEASIPEHLAAGDPACADMALYGARELRNVLDVIVGPRWPIWVAQKAGALLADDDDGPSLTEELHITLAHNKYAREELARQIDEARERDERGDG